ncbi:DUF6541 family protein [Pseudonocardia phyllosphaerae]|uniref:DUF6541 family protein n=1 Tax=Pseudonocardia phyllosphaerae TaxID=3390502 RepID=UPI00397BE5D5
MTWAVAVPVALVAAMWTVLPGLIVTRALGWRGIAGWGTAPLFSVALIATTAVVAGKLGVAWGPWPVVVATALATGAVCAGRIAIGRPPSLRCWSPRATGRTLLRGDGPDGRYGGLALVVGTAVTVMLGGVTLVLALGRPDAISPTYDAVHHYSAVARILDVGDGSTLTLGELTAPGRPAVYPAAWHDVVALVVTTVGTSIPAASNLVAFVVAAVVWPLSCVLLVRQLVGRRPGTFVAAPVLSTAFTAMPWMLMTWGVLWPNLLGLALLPAGLAAVVTLLKLTREPAFGPRGALLLGAVALPALGLAHPNAAVSLLVLGVSPVVWAAGAAAAGLVRSRRWRWVPVPVLAALATASAVLWLLAWSPFLAAVRSYDWPASRSPGTAVVELAGNGTNGRPALVVVSALVVVGAVVALRRARTGWLVPAQLTSGFLYVLAVATEGRLTEALTGAWYNDSYRLAAMVPVTAVPLATLGVVGPVAALTRALVRVRAPEMPVERRRLVATATVATTAAVLVLATDGFRIGVHAITVAKTYQHEATWMLQPGQREFLEAAGRALPDGAVVATNPWAGNSLLYPLTGHRVMFPHMSGSWTPAQQVVRNRLRDAASDPAVCPAVRETGLEYVIDGPVSYWPSHASAHSYPGITGIGTRAGFEPVLSGGGSTLYRVTACGPLGDGATP